MQRSLSSLKFENDSHQPSETRKSSRCNTCGQEFDAPLFSVLSSGSLLEKYYACPKCLSKVGGVEFNKTVEADKAEAKDEKFNEMEGENKMEETVACAHHSGYLKRRPKNTPIPEECLTCTKMIECISC